MAERSQPLLLRVIARLNVGGPARHVLRLHEPLRRRGWRTLLVTGRPGAGEGDLLDEALAAGQEVHVLPELGREISPLRDARALLALRALLRERQPALLHTHTAKAGVLGRLAARGLQPRPALVHSFHGHVLSGYFGAAASQLWCRTERALARRTDALIAVAPQVRDELLERHGVGRPGQYRILPPGFDAERVRPDARAGAALRARLGVPAEAVLVGSLGRLAPIKAVDALLAAFAAARADCPRLRLLVLGDGPEAERLAPALAAPGVVHLPPQRELGEVYGALDLLALSSRAEGCPQVVAEALSAGVPVLSTSVGGVPWLVRDGGNGRLVPAGDTAALTAALRELSRDDALRARLAAGARATDLSAHDAEAVAEALAALYAELLARPALENAGAAAQTRAACTSSS